MVITLRVPTFSRRLLAILAAVLAVLLVAETVVLAAAVKRNGGAVTAVRTATASDSVITTSTDWSQIPGMSTTVSVPSGQRALLVITFSGTSWCDDTAADGSPSTYCFVRVRVNGADVPSGALVLDSAEEGRGYGARSMQFVAGPMNAGTHTVNVHWRVDESDGHFYLLQRTLTVLRSKVG